MCNDNDTVVFANGRFKRVTDKDGKTTTCVQRDGEWVELPLIRTVTRDNATESDHIVLNALFGKG